VANQDVLTNPMRPSRGIRGHPNGWSTENDALLGQYTDIDVAKKLGVSVQSVWNRRSKLGIEAYGRPINRVVWTDAMDALIGTDTDAAIGARLGVTGRSVLSRRKNLGIATPVTNNQKIVWTQEIDAMIASATNLHVSRLFGMSVVAVSKRRAELGLPTIAKRAPHAKFTAEMDAALVNSSAREAAEALGVTIEQVYWRRERLGLAAIHNAPRFHRSRTGEPLVLDQKLLAKIRNLEPVLLEQFEKNGLPIRKIEDWQIIEVAIDFLIKNKGLI
jgi:hypothetical protein